MRIASTIEIVAPQPIEVLINSDVDNFPIFDFLFLYLIKFKTPKMIKIIGSDKAISAIMLFNNDPTIINIIRIII